MRLHAAEAAGCHLSRRGRGRRVCGTEGPAEAAWLRVNTPLAALTLPAPSQLITGPAARALPFIHCIYNRLSHSGEALATQLERIQQSKNNVNAFSKRTKESKNRGSMNGNGNEGTPQNFTSRYHVSQKSHNKR